MSAPARDGDRYGDAGVARCGLVIATPLIPSVAQDADAIILPHGWTIDPETGRGVPEGWDGTVTQLAAALARRA